MPVCSKCSVLYQELRAINDQFQLDYQLYYWRTVSQLEVDFVLYGEKGLHAFEIKRKQNIQPHDLKGLKAFCQDYPVAKAYLLYGGSLRKNIDGIELVPFQEALFLLKDWLMG